MVVANVLSKIEEVLSKKDLQVLQTPLCGYRTFGNFLDATPWEHLHPTMPHAVCEPPKLRATLPGLDEFDGFAWAEWTSHHWEIPITACVVYLVGIYLLKRFMAERKPIRLQPVVLGWNFGLAAFSFAGMAYCVPHLLFGEHGVVNRGFTGAVCSHAATYGSGRVGFFVALFIYSKVSPGPSPSPSPSPRP